MNKNQFDGILDVPFHEQAALFESVLQNNKRSEMQHLSEASLFFFLVAVLARSDALNPWICDRCAEIQRDPDGHLDLWARFHYKSTIITFAQTLRDLALDPEQTFGIFSHTKQIARGFSKQLQLEMEQNPVLHHLWPDIFWREPRKESPQWSQDAGLIVRRSTNPKEASIEAWGLVDGQPTSRHYRTQIYDDVVTIESVGTPDQIAKTTAAWEISLALGTENTRIRYAGTRYHPSDTYSEIIKRGSASVRIHAATVTGTMEGTPVLISRESLERFKRDMGPRAFSAQMLLNPVSADTATFREEWLMFYQEPPPPREMNIWIIVDPAGGKDKRARKDGQGDFTVMEVVGLAADQNYYTLPGTIRDRMNLVQRTDALFSLKRRYPSAQVGYEEYGMQADIEHIRERQEREHYRFPIIPLGGKLPKMQRIERLVPLFQQGRWWHPYRLPYRDRDGEIRDYTHEFKTDEYLPCPVLPHDDMLDCKARIFDVPATFPRPTGHAASPGRASNSTNSSYDPLK